MVEKRIKQENIHLGRHGEDYGNWMSNPVFYMAGGLLAITAVLAVLSFTVFHITVLGMIFTGAAVVLLALLLWITWIRRQYAFDGGGMMEKVHQILLSHLDYDGKGNLLEVAAAQGRCPSGRLSHGRNPQSPASIIGALFIITANPSAKRTQPAKGWAPDACSGGAMPAN